MLNNELASVVGWKSRQSNSVHMETWYFFYFAECILLYLFIMHTSMPIFSVYRCFGYQLCLSCIYFPSSNIFINAVSMSIPFIQRQKQGRWRYCSIQSIYRASQKGLFNFVVFNFFLFCIDVPTLPFIFSIGDDFLTVIESIILDSFAWKYCEWNLWIIIIYLPNADHLHLSGPGRIITWHSSFLP